MTMTMPALDEANGKLADRRKRLHDIFAEAGPEMDMTKVKSIDGDSKAKVDAIRVLNEEIDALADERKGYLVLLRGAEHAADGGDDGRKEAGDGAEVRREKTLGEEWERVIGAAVKDGGMVRGKEYELDVDLKTVLSTSAGWAPQSIRNDRLVDFATRPIALLDRIPTVTTTQAAVVYMEETTFTNAAAETSEAAAKPEATLAYTERTSTVRKIAVTLPVTDEQLDDIPRMRQVLSNRLPFMVRQRLASQILVGDGSAPNLRGLLNVSGIQTQAKGADPTPDAIYKAMVLIVATGQSQPDTVVLHPLDWQDIRLLRTADGIYIWGNPSEAGPERLWGLPVVQEQGLTQNTGVVGDFGNFAELNIRKGLTVESGYVNDDFSKNKTTLRAEMRAAIVFYRPAAFCTVTGI